MKIAIGYPPFDDIKGTPLLSQNRQYQVFHNPTYIYPVIPAYAATMLRNAGYEIFWLDGIAEKWSYQKWLEEVKKVNPNLIMMETKTPVIKRHWKIINDIKRHLRGGVAPAAHLGGGQGSGVKIVLVGDHVTALPEESFQNSKVDYILTGGDYDFLLLNLVNHLEKGEKLEPGVYSRNNVTMKQSNNEIIIKNTGKFLLNHDLNKIPVIDRELTKWRLYAYKNGVYKRTPGIYIMAGRDCWWRAPSAGSGWGCTFCAWTVLYPQYRVREVENVLDEIGELIERYRVREIMDDTGTFPAGEWLRKFCQGMISRGYHKKIYFDCNLRFGVLTRDDYKLLAQAGFRFLLYGLESASQKTLDKLNKGTKVDKIEQELQIVKEVSREVGGHLEPHVTCMVGYPWETKEEAEKTVRMTRQFFDKGLIDTLQATIVIPYPGTALFAQCQKNGWLKTKNWDDYDMSKPLMKTSMTDDQVRELTQGIYKSFLTPRFITRKILSIRNLDDLAFFWRAGKAVLGHLADFGKR